MEKWNLGRCGIYFKNYLKCIFDRVTGISHVSCRIAIINNFIKKHGEKMITFKFFQFKSDIASLFYILKKYAFESRYYTEYGLLYVYKEVRNLKQTFIGCPSQKKKYSQSYLAILLTRYLSFARFASLLHL